MYGLHYQYKEFASPRGVAKRRTRGPNSAASERRTPIAFGVRGDDFQAYSIGADPTTVRCNSFALVVCWNFSFLSGKT